MIEFRAAATFKTVETVEIVKIKTAITVKITTFKIATTTKSATIVKVEIPKYYRAN